MLITNVRQGSYYLVETDAPAGYLLSADKAEVNIVFSYADYISIIPPVVEEDEDEEGLAEDEEGLAEDEEGTDTTDEIDDENSVNEDVDENTNANDNVVKDSTNTNSEQEVEVTANVVLADNTNDNIINGIVNTENQNITTENEDSNNENININGNVEEDENVDPDNTNITDNETEDTDEEVIEEPTTIEDTYYKSDAYDVSYKYVDDINPILITVVAQDEPILLEVIKVTNQGDLLGDCELALYKYDETAEDNIGEEYATWITSSETSQVFSAIPAGKYVLVENAAADGYAIADNIIVDVQAINDLNTVTMVDDLHIWGVASELIQTGDMTNLLLLGGSVLFIGIILGIIYRTCTSRKEMSSRFWN
jgi:hypothetical protein